jgi:hypothetical protein
MTANERGAKQPENEGRELQIEDLDQDGTTNVTDEKADALRGGARSNGSTDVFSDPPEVG